MLDLGCGTGEPVARYFIDHHWSVTGVDFSVRMLELATKYVPEMRTVKSDMLDITFKENNFDAITATYSLFHIPAQSHFELFQKLFLYLKPEGSLLFTYATKDYTGYDTFNGFKTFMERDLFYSHKTPNELYSDLESIGFNIVSSENICIQNETFLWVTVTKPAS